MSEACCHPQTKFVKVMFFTRVCHSVHGGGSSPLHAGIHTHPLPPDQRPKPPPRTRGRYTPWGRHPPGSEAGVPPRHQRQVPPRADTPARPEAGTPPPPLDQRQVPPGAVHAGRYGQQAGGTHPIGMQSCFCNISYVANAEPDILSS